MATLVDLVLYAIIVGLLALLLGAYLADGWTKLEKKSNEALRQDVAFGAGG
ncbi:hypothetical protein ACN082_01665 [Rothia sp. CCM 9417]|uniref:hypothetical protein n=1 Tax=unclassified Rothia (in: high G+C Gram-positive bacteria) TaxID=2689056 RepID=UPI003AD69D09